MLAWIDGRWHCDGLPIYDVSMWWLQCSGGEILVRIESADQGRRLIAHYDVKGRSFTTPIMTEFDFLRSPC